VAGDGTGAVRWGLGLLTIFWHDWIEALTGWDPDHGDGSAEWLVVAGLLAAAIVMGLLARRHWVLLTPVPGHVAAVLGGKGGRHGRLG
jgi:hypothetical protein